MSVFKKDNKEDNTYNAKHLLVVPDKGLMSFFEKHKRQKIMQKNYLMPVYKNKTRNKTPK